MRTDPNKACANKQERLLWALLHDGIAHPLMAITLFSRWSLWFHDLTSQLAWPRPSKARPKARPAKTGLAYVTSDAAECEFYRQSMRAQGYPCWTQSTPLPDGTVSYQYGPL